jgi:hypothetical protein
MLRHRTALFTSVARRRAKLHRAGLLHAPRTNRGVAIGLWFCPRRYISIGVGVKAK